jgi:hypothetical protein
MRPTNTILRQHETTSIPELRGARCLSFLAVQNASNGLIGPLFLELDAAWHRFYLDAGLLFWEQGIELDTEQEVLAEERVVDLGRALGTIGAAVEEIEMRDCQLRLVFDRGARLVLRHGVRDDGTTVVEPEAIVRNLEEFACRDDVEHAVRVTAGKLPKFRPLK